MVDATVEGRGCRGTAEGEVPFEEVGFERCCVVVGGGLLGELGGFFEDAFDGGVLA